MRALTTRNRALSRRQGIDRPCERFTQPLSGRGLGWAFRAPERGADDAAKVNWWGGNKDFKFDRVVTAWVTRGDNGYQGTIGVGDAAGVKAKNINNLLQNNLQVGVEGDAIVLGVKRTDVTDKIKMKLIAAVGSNTQWNDDIPNTRSVTIDLLAPRPARGIRELDLDRNNFRFPPDYQTLAQARTPWPFLVLCLE